MELETAKGFGVALAIGALIGLERERAKLAEPKDPNDPKPPDQPPEPETKRPEPEGQTPRQEAWKPGPAAHRRAKPKSSDREKPSRRSGPEKSETLRTESFRSGASAAETNAPSIGLPENPSRAPRALKAAEAETLTAGSPEGRSSEPRSPEFAGIRTFPLIALCGALMAHLTPQLGPGVFIVGFAGFTALVTAAYLRTAIDEANTGITTAVSALLVFGLSGLCMFDQLELCAAIAIAVYLILAYKPPLRSLVRSIQSQDIYAIGKFGAVALLVLPLLPNQTYGPFDVLNPYKIWLMVVLIAAVSLVGYLAVKVLGAQLGFGLTGLLGGLVSSTAVTVTFSRKSREHEALARSCALAILLACTIMSPRILIIVGLLDAKILKLLWMPLAAITLAGLIGCGLLYWRTRKEAQEHPDDLQLSNPFELAPALKFAAVFTVILFGSKVLQHYLGDTGLYLSGAAAGLANTDPIILSMCELSADDVITDRAAVLSITLAVITNTLSKAGIALYMAAPGTRTWVASILGAQAAAGGAVAGALALWSESL